MNKQFVFVCICLYLVLKLFTSLTIYECLSVDLFVFCLLSFVDNLGKKLIILDIAILVSILTCLLLPIAGYHYFDINNRMSRSWVTYMRVPSDYYYSYMFPATVAFIVGIKIKIFFRNQTYRFQEQYIIKVKRYVANMKWQGLVMVGIGLGSSLFENYIPAVLSQVLWYFKFLMFVGIFYCLYSDLPNKRLVLLGVFGVMFMRSISGGMFGEMVFMGAMTVILVVMGKSMKFRTKFVVMLVGLFGIIILQSVKPAFRKQTWFGKNQQNKLAIFTNILAEKVSDPTAILNDQRMLFVMYGRFNQGQIVSNVLHSVPLRFPFANGETIVTSLAASVVPRFLWPDKPQAGGAYNFQRFLGIKLKGWSANISPFGEAYANFGVVGGIVFMFFFGLLFNLIFQLLLKIAVKVPSLILWFPFLFIYAVSIETDVLTMINSFTKASIFAYLMFKFFPRVLKLRI